ncbi:hypothetical protein, partial [Streptomyces sp. NPDC048845]|uniref:hypothetical protein n=1 Tax=Streptomyces sp. NPDC048845 TaxID=3155390 RepID=UPI003420C735
MLAARGVAVARGAAAVRAAAVLLCVAVVPGVAVVPDQLGDRVALDAAQLVGVGEQPPVERGALLQFVVGAEVRQPAAVEDGDAVGEPSRRSCRRSLGGVVLRLRFGLGLGGVAAL